MLQMPGLVDFNLHLWRIFNARTSGYISLTQRFTKTIPTFFISFPPQKKKLPQKRRHHRPSMEAPNFLFRHRRGAVFSTLSHDLPFGVPLEVHHLFRFDGLDSQNLGQDVPKTHMPSWKIPMFNWKYIFFKNASIVESASSFQCAVFVNLHCIKSKSWMKPTNQFLLHRLRKGRCKNGTLKVESMVLLQNDGFTVLKVWTPKGERFGPHSVEASL